MSGRIIEYTWHIIFGKNAVHCPIAKECYCNLYGLCDLRCEDEGTCREQYKLPKHTDMPKGWPEFGWDGEKTNISGFVARFRDL